MDKADIALFAGLITIAAALVGAGQESVRGFIAKLPGLTLGGGGASAVPPQPAPVNNAPGVDVFNLPRNRKLTEGEITALADHVVSKYGFRTRMAELRAIAFQESSFRPWVFRNESGGRQSVGLMQTLEATAQDLWDKGYKAQTFPTRASLKDPLVSMYYGAAYLDWLRAHWPGKKNPDWYIRAYNGGPGWEKTGAGPSMTAEYLAKVKNHAATFAVTVKETEAA